MVGSFDATKFVYNAGIALTYEMDSGAVMYFEVEYHSVQTKNTTDYTPFIHGFRW